MFDILGFVGTICWIVPTIVYVMVLNEQWKFVTNESLSVHVFVLRAATILPIFMTFILLGLWLPSLYAALKVPAAIAEGYAVYCMFAFLVKCVGGPPGAIDSLEKSENRWYDWGDVLSLVCIQKVVWRKLLFLK